MREEYDVLVRVVVQTRYRVTAESQDDAMDRVQAVLDSGDYDDTDALHWQSQGAEIDGAFIASGHYDTLPMIVLDDA